MISKSEKYRQAYSQMRAGQEIRALAAYKALLADAAIAPFLRAQVNLDVARLVSNRGDTDMARKLLHNAVLANPMLVEAHRELAGINTQQVHSSKLFSVILPTYNRLHEVQESIASLRRNTISPLEIIVVTDPCTDGTSEYLRREHESGRLVAVINQEHLGYTKSINNGIRKAKGDYICLFGDDATVMPGWDLAMRLAIDEQPTIGAGTPLVINPDGTLQSPGEHNPFRSAYYDWLGNVPYVDTKSALGHPPASFPQFHQPRIVDYGYFHVLKRECIEAAGYLDESYRHYFTDPDQGYQLQKSGLNVLYVPTSVYIHHELSKQNYSAVVEKAYNDEETYVLKWGLYEIDPMTGTRKHLSRDCVRKTIDMPTATAYDSPQRTHSAPTASGITA